MLEQSTRSAPGGSPPGGQVERLYGAIRDMAIAYRLRPGESLNEAKLARNLGGSRTPLREALNRLTAEGFLKFEHTRGFFGRDFTQAEIQDLYELRAAIEGAGVRLACTNAPDAVLAKVAGFLRQSGSRSKDRSAADLVALDEQFHEALMVAGGNKEMLRTLKNVNARIKFFRWIDMGGRRVGTQRQHRQILAAVRDRDAAGARALMHDHITARLDQITGAVREGISRIYLDDGEHLLTPQPGPP